MSKFNINKLNKKPCESRSGFMLRLAKSDIKENSDNVVEPLLKHPPDNKAVTPDMTNISIIKKNNPEESNIWLGKKSDHEDQLLEVELQGSSKYISELPLLPAIECSKIIHDTHSTTSILDESGPSNLSEQSDRKYFIETKYQEESNKDTDSFNEDSDDSIADKNYEPPSDIQVILPPIADSSNEDSDDIITEANLPPVTRLKKLTRKRLRNSDSWEKHVKKGKRNLGEEYINAAKKKVEKKEMRGPCNEKCRIRCTTKIMECQRKIIFEAYWKLGSIDRQRSFIDSHISEISPAYRNIKPGSNRSKNLKYTLQVDDKVIQVCKTFFKNTLAINNRTIFTTTKKKDEQGFLTTDQRGKHGKQKKIKEEVIQEIRDHINSFPKVSSHYCRARTKKEYLDGSLNIATMYRLYVDNCKENNKEYAKVSMYSKIINTETNISFHVPKKDQCGLCASYENGNEEQKNDIRSKYEAHLSEKDLSRQEKNEDGQSDENFQVLCFDLQAVLTTPCGEMSSFYYKRRLASYNFTFFDIKQKVGHCFFWHEGIAKRGSNEIGSCIYSFLNSEACKSKNIIFYSDNCAGQNKNKFLFSLYLFCVMYNKKIETITHKFLEKGHTQNEGDSMHATIEKEKNRVINSGPIYVPAQWATIIKSAKKTGLPYNVNEICTQDVYNLKSLCTEMGNNFVNNTDQEKVVWRDLRLIKVEKSQPNIIFYKTSYAQDTFKSISIKRNIKQLRNQEQKEIQLKQAYKKPPSIDIKKKKDLLDLCKDSSIRPVYWEFYQNLTEKADEVDSSTSESD